MTSESAPRSTRSRTLYVWIAYWIVLFIVMHRPPSDMPHFRPGSDKIAHFFLYFVLALLGGRSLRSIHRGLTLRRLTLWALVYSVYAAADEWLQQFVGRDMSLGDWLADVAGIAAATFLLAASHGSGQISEPRGPAA